MTQQQLWFPGRVDRKQLGTAAMLPRCDDPPTTALALEAAALANANTEDVDGERRA